MNRSFVSLFLWTLSISATSGFVTLPTPSSPQGKWLREAEKKHARAALVALPVLTGLSTVTPDPVSWLNSQPASTQLLFYAGAAVLETWNLRRLDKGFALKEDELPGNVLGCREAPTLDVLEDIAGRSAMMVVFGMLVAACVP